MTYEMVRFGDLYAEDSRNGLTKPSRVRGSGYKMINMGELFANDRIFDIPMELVPLKDSEKKNAKVEKGDLLFARQSLVLEGAGKCSIVMEVSPLTVFESHIIRIRLKSDIADPLFYYYYFKSPFSPIKTIVSQCAQAGIRGSELQELEVAHPPIEWQKIISTHLSRYDELIENNRRQVELLEELLQRIYKEWFLDLHFPGHENVTIEKGVPIGWEKRKLSELVSVLRRGISPNYDEEGQYTVISQKCIRSSIMDISEARRQKKEYNEELNLQNADTVICSTGTGTLGRVGQVFGDYPDTTFDSHVTLVRAKKYPNYLYSAIKAQQDFLMGMGRGSTNQQELYKAVIEELDILVPADPVISKYEAIATDIHNEITNLKTSSMYAAEARDRMALKLMSGEIEL